MVVTSIGDAWVARPSSCWFISVHRGLHSVYCDLGEASDFGEVQLYSLKMTLTSTARCHAETTHANFSFSLFKPF